MNAKTARNIFSIGVLASIVVACGGGGDEAVGCQVANINPVFCVPIPDRSALSLAPDTLTVGNCTTRIPFIFKGGVAPYTIFTSDNFNAPVSSALTLGDGRSYFFADLKFPAGGGGGVTLTVLDSQSRTAVASVAAQPSTQACPTNPLLLVSPESANFRASEILAFQVSGGPSPLGSLSVAFADTGVAELVEVTATPAGTATVTVRGKAPGATLMTIEAVNSRQRASVVINVLPQP